VVVAIAAAVVVADASVAKAADAEIATRNEMLFHRAGFLTGSFSLATGLRFDTNSLQL
jgi:hypothetical protein